MPVPKYKVLESMCARYGFTRKEMGKFLDQQNVQDAADLCVKVRNVYDIELPMKVALYITRECEYLG